MTNTVTAVEIPADVKDNSQTVTDYAFARYRAPDRGVVSPAQRDRTVKTATAYLVGYTHYQWQDTNPDGQRCRFDMIVNHEGDATYLLHTEYFTRVACAECEHSYASTYQVISTEEGSSEAVPRCDDHGDRFRRSVVGEPGVTMHESERLRIGQHD